MNFKKTIIMLSIFTSTSCYAADTPKLKFKEYSCASLISEMKSDPDHASVKMFMIAAYQAGSTNSPYLEFSDKAFNDIAYIIAQRCSAQVDQSTSVFDVINSIIKKLPKIFYGHLLS